MNKKEPITPFEWNQWRDSLLEKNGFLVLSKLDRKIIDRLIVEKVMSLGPKTPPKVPGDKPWA